MQPTLPLRALTSLIAVALVMALAPAAEAAPSLTMTQNCEDYPPSSGVDIHLEGLPPNEAFTALLEFFNDDGSPAGSIGPITGLTVDASGSFSQSLGSSVPQTYKATVEWAGGTLQATKRVDCSKPDVDDNDYAAQVIVNNPTWATSGDGHRKRGFVVKVSNLGKGPLDVSAEDVAAKVLVNGAPKGTVRLVSSKVVKPGKRVKFRYAWRYRHVSVGDEVEYSGCVNSTGDPNGDNDCASYTITAEAKP